MDQVDAGAGPVVLAGSMDSRGSEAPGVLGDRLRGKGARGAAPFAERVTQVILRVGADQVLGQAAGLGQEEIPPDRGGMLLVGGLVDRLGRDDVQDRQPRYRPGVVQGHPQRHPGAAVMPGHREPAESQRRHHGDLVLGHGALGVALMLRAARRLAAVPVPAKIRAHHREPPGQHRRDLVPHHVSLRIAVQQQHRRPGPAAADVHRDPVRSHLPGCEAREHTCPATRLRAS